MSYRVKKNSPIEFKLNDMITRLIESGIPINLEQFSWHIIATAGIVSPTQITLNQPVTSQEATFNTSNLWIFIIPYITMLFISSIIFILEFLYYRFSNIHRQ